MPQPERAAPSAHVRAARPPEIVLRAVRARAEVFRCAGHPGGCDHKQATHLTASRSQITQRHRHTRTQGCVRTVVRAGRRPQAVVSFGPPCMRASRARRAITMLWVGMTCAYVYCSKMLHVTALSRNRNMIRFIVSLCYAICCSAAYCVQWCTEAVPLDDLAGEPLGPQEVMKARKWDIDYLGQMHVYREVPIQEARDRGHQVLRARWVDVKKVDSTHRTRSDAKDIDGCSQPHRLASR